jgi:hypothetical protein
MGWRVEDKYYEAARFYQRGNWVKDSIDAASGKEIWIIDIPIAWNKCFSENY